MLLTLILCGLFYLYSYVSLNLQTSDNLLNIFSQMLKLTLGILRFCALRNRLRHIYLLRKYDTVLTNLVYLRIFALQKYFRSSLRAISTGQLHTLLHFHLRPINQVVFLGPYLWGNLILKGASRLDAFSVYPVRT